MTSLRDVDRWIERVMLTDSEGAVETLMAMWLTIFLVALTLITMPLWVVPYLIIKHRRVKHDES